MRRRFDAQPTYAWSEAPGAPELRLHTPRSPSGGALQRLYVVQPGDRLDTIAAAWLGDPHAGWRIVDANPTLSPEELLQVGRVLTIPEIPS